MKKFLSLLLSLSLLASVSVSALAANAPDSSMTDRLKAVTLKVKETLNISDSFTSFNGNLNETGNASLWSLSWSNSSESIYVTANEKGAIVSYNDSMTGANVPAYGRIPKFPAMTLDDAKTIAASFLKKVMDTTVASVDLQGNSYLDYSGSATYYMNGSMKLYGTETPVDISISVSTATRQVVNFYRGDYGQAYDGITKPAAAADKTAAAATLKGTLNMKMVYALPGDGTHTARLQYLPNPGGSYVVDAATGRLVDLSALDYSQDGGYLTSGKSAPESAATASMGSGITPTEQASIDKLQGVLSQNELEQSVRAYTELGLTNDFKLQNVNYYTYQDASKQTKVTASLQFTYAPQDGKSQFRSVSLDAKTGKLLSVTGNIIYNDTKSASTEAKYTGAQTEATARSFAGKILPEELKQTVLSTDTAAPTYDTSLRNYTFNRTHDGIAFPENYISVGVDSNTGYVVSFYYSWYDYEVTFPAAAGAIKADAAASKYSEGAGIALKYVSVPTSLQADGLLLAYTTANAGIWGVNALTGELLKATAVDDTGLKYDDLSGNPDAAIINKLASYGIGFSGGSFKPNAQLTQLDALMLIESTNGRKVVPLVSAGETDDVYNTAYAMGILTPAEKDPAKLLSRAEFVKYLVNALGYNEVAGLTGIYKPGFSDDSAIPPELVGYVAIAKGLGIIRGDQNGGVRPNDTATRTQAAIMLYNCMSRK